jgi:uncharacterized membrane protein YdjX (TVP38/TMEM64 family)
MDNIAAPQSEKSKFYKILDYSWILIAILLFIASIKYLNDGTLGAKVDALGIWAPLVIMLLKISTLVFAPLGGTPLYIIAGVSFGTLEGFLICFVGDVIGSAICFMIGRRFGMRVVRYLAGNQNLRYVEKAVGLLGNTKSFIKARIAFISLPEILAYAAGLSRIGFWKFLFLHSIFYVPVVFVLVATGAAAAQFTAKYAILVSLVGFIVASIGIWFLSKDYRKIEGM